MDLSSLRVDPKYLNEDRGPYLRRILITLFVLGFVFVALRMTARRIAKIPLMYDDYMLIFILVMYLGTTILAGFVIQFGLGRHLLTLSIKGISRFLWGVYIYTILYTVTMPLLKLALLMFYARIFTVPSFQLAARIVAVLMVMLQIAFGTVVVFQCSPIHYFWTQYTEPGPGKCINISVFLYASIIINVFFDFVVLLLPMPHVWGLRIPRSQKVIVTGIFCLGALTCIVSILRIPTVEGVISGDATWNGVTQGIWTMTEISLGIVCTSLPAMRPILRKICGTKLGSWVGNGDPQTCKAPLSPSWNDTTSLSWPRKISAASPFRSFCSYRDDAKLTNESSRPRAPAPAWIGYCEEPWMTPNTIRVKRDIEWSVRVKGDSNPLRGIRATDEWDDCDRSRPKSTAKGLRKVGTLGNV